MPICDVCLNLYWDLYPDTSSRSKDQTLGNEKNHTIGSSDSLVLSANLGCERCSILHQGIDAFRQYTASLLPPWEPWDLSGPCTVDIILRPGRSLHLGLTKSGHDWEEEQGKDSVTQPRLRYDIPLGREKYEIDIEYFTLADHPAPPWAAFRLGKQVPEILDKKMAIQAIQDWLSSCTDQHTCVSKQLPKLPTRVLDLAPLAAGKPIGGSKIIETQKKTLAMMKRGIPWSTLPRTFQDAIEISQELSIQYMWIDSLCIIQDDTADWERESSVMATIYANTYLNIAATCSKTSDDGCLKLRWMEAMVLDQVWSCPVKNVRIEGSHEGRPFEIFARLEQWRAHEDFLKNDNVSDIHIRSPLLARAWVFQELYLSARTIHFHSSEMIWECKECVRCECTELKNEMNRENALSRRRQLEIPFLSDPNQRLFFWLSIVNEYCQLNLTHESERLPALAGFASRFQDQIAEKYFGGMWRNDLVRMLLWCLTHPKAECIRSRPPSAPSWSWASIVEYENPDTRGDNSPQYILVQGSCTSFKQDVNAKILKVVCTASGINPFGQVSTGTIFIRGIVIHSILVRRRLLTHIGVNAVSTTINLNWDNSVSIDSLVSTYSVEYAHKFPEICVAADLIFEQEEDDAVVITRQSLLPDIRLGEKEGILDGDGVICLLLGTSEIPWSRGVKLPRIMASCLVLRHSINREGAFERIGIMMCDSDSIIFQHGASRVVELV
ncbi:hypothetical protein G7Y89_g11505 [Cudoniella acicularis]|uniref:Heterokaryon incompatibility domain-containing protein n=1 Tax=Cudoniella acicularis TaxID=354080 RepID=A0A8H4VXT1_9HELO|nr:hypothetical protein G7Y89_g11505 [Cudoniella acicularis]